MTGLRDARLKRALDQAPDAQLRPPARVREAIGAAAHDAVTPAWRRWWQSAGRGAPWSAAFATVALATLVTVLWQGQEIPGARSPVPGADAPVPSAAPSNAPAPPAPATAEPPVEPAPATPPAPATSPAPATPPAPAPAPAPPAAPAALPSVPPTQPPPVQADTAAHAELADRAAPASAAAKAQLQTKDRGAEREAQVTPRARAQLQAAAPAAARAAAPQRSSEAAALLREAAAATPAGAAWSQVRIEAQGQSMVATREQAGRLPELLGRLDQALGAAGASGVPTLTLELGRGDQALGTLEEAGGEWRWRPLGGRAVALQVDAALAAALRAEAGRVLRR